MDSMDWNFMRFDQRMSGALYRNLKLGIDIRYSEFLDALDAYYSSGARRLRRSKIKRTEDYRKIAVHAELRQEGGLENLLASGFTKAEVLKYKNEGALTKGQRALLKVDDLINNELYPVLRDTYETHYNHEIGPKVKGYYPRIRDWEQYDSLAIEQGRFVVGNAVPRRTKTASGMTIQRKEKCGYKEHGELRCHHEQAFGGRALHDTDGTGDSADSQDCQAYRSLPIRLAHRGQKIFSDYVDTLSRATAEWNPPAGCTRWTLSKRT